MVLVRIKSCFCNPKNIVIICVERIKMSVHRKIKARFRLCFKTKYYLCCNLKSLLKMWKAAENESFRKMVTLEERVLCNFFSHEMYHKTSL